MKVHTLQDKLCASTQCDPPSMILFSMIGNVGINFSNRSDFNSKSVKIFGNMHYFPKFHTPIRFFGIFICSDKLKKNVI